MRAAVWLAGMLLWLVQACVLCSWARQDKGTWVDKVKKAVTPAPDKNSNGCSKERKRER